MINDDALPLMCVGVKKAKSLGAKLLIFACWVIFPDYLQSADCFKNKLFKKNLSEIPIRAPSPVLKIQ